MCKRSYTNVMSKLKTSRIKIFYKNNLDSCINAANIFFVQSKQSLLLFISKTYDKCQKKKAEPF